MCICLLQDITNLTVMSHLGCDPLYCQRCRAYYLLPQYTCSNSQMKYIHPAYAWSSAPLPHDNLHWSSFSRSGMLEYKSLYYLSFKRIINWCPSLSTLYPVLTSGIFLFFFLDFVVYVTIIILQFDQHSYGMIFILK